MAESANDDLAQVLVLVRHGSLDGVDGSGSALLRCLARERDRDPRVAFNHVKPAGMIALVAPHEVIERIRQHPDVTSVTADEPFHSVDDSSGDSDLR